MINIYLSRDINKNSVLFDKIENNLKKGIESYYFVPDQYTLFSDINLIEKLDTDILMDVKVKSFSSFSNEVLSKYGGLRKKVLTETGKNMLIKEILIEKQDDLNVFTRNINRKGFASQLCKSIKELKDSSIGPKKFKEVAESTDKLSRLKLLDLALVYEEYEKRIENVYLDSNDKLNLLYEKLEYADEFAGKHFFFDKYNTLNAQELAIVSKLEEKGAIIHFFLIMDPVLTKRYSTDEIDDGELFESSFSLYKKLNEIGKDLKIIPMEYEIKNNKDFLARNLFSYKTLKGKSDAKDIGIAKCKNTKEEVELVTEIIKKSIITSKSSYSDFTIVTANEGEYNKYIKRIFKEEGIPFFIDSKKSLLDNKLAGFIVSSLRLFSYKFQPEDVLSFLKFLYFDKNYERLETFEKYIMARKIRGEMFFDAKYFSVDERYLQAKKDTEIEKILADLKTTNELRLDFIDLVGDFYQEAKKKMPINAYIEGFFNFLQKDPIKEAISDYLASQEDDEKLNSYNEQSWDFFISILDELSDMQGEKKTDFRSFAEILISGFEEESIGLIPPYQDVVFVGSLSRSRTNNVKNMFILGLVDDYFPSKPNSSSLIDDTERLFLRENELDIGLRNEYDRSEEFINLYANILKAQSKLYISSSLMDSENRSLTESIYFNQVNKIFPNILSINAENSLANPKYSKSLLRKSLSLNLEEKLASNKIGDREGELIKYFYNKNDDKFMAALAKLKRPIDKLSRPTEIFTSPSVSISRIENFARCPYKHFIEYGLSPDEDISYDIENREIGTIAHRSISSFVRSYKNNPSRYKEISDQDFKLEIFSLFDADIKDLIDDKRLEADKNRLLLEVQKESLFTGINNLRRHLNLSSFTPSMSELSFGRDKKIPPLRIDLGDKTIELEGIIDRVDSLQTDKERDVLVVDYKTGSKQFSLDMVLAGIDVQLPIYLRAIENADPNNKGVGFFYLPIKDYLIYLETEDEEAILKELFDKLKLDGVVLKDPDLLKAIDKDIDDNPTVIRFRGYGKPLNKDNVLSKDAMDKLVDDVLEISKKNIGKIYGGDIKAHPYYDGSISACYYCDYANMCKFDLRKNAEYRMIEKRDWGEYKND